MKKKSEMIKFDVRYFMPYLLSSVDRLPSDRRLAYDVVGKIFISYPRPSGCHHALYLNLTIDSFLYTSVSLM